MNILSQGPATARIFTTVLARKDDPKKRSKLTKTTRKKPADVEPLSTDSAVRDIPELTEKSASTISKTVRDPIDVKDFPQNPGELFSADRGTVLKACVRTSAGMSLAAFLVRQVSHSAIEGGWQVPDLTVEMPYKTELWHIEPTVAVVVLVTSLRQILLRVWPDFAQSSHSANKQILGSLKPADYFTVSYLSGISEEFLFRGALLPVLGPDWKGVLGAAVIFGALHLSGGRNASFAVWASFVGIVYGVLSLYTCDLATPMAAHSASNLLGAALWKMSQNDSDENSL